MLKWILLLAAALVAWRLYAMHDAKTPLTFANFKNLGGFGV